MISIGKNLHLPNDKVIRDRFLQQIKESVDVAKRCGATWMVVVPGVINHGPSAYQKANVMDTLRRATDILAPHNLALFEPLNFRDHPSQVLPDIPNIYEMVKSVNSPACKMLFDIYHVQIHTGNIIPNLDRAWDEIVYIQQGDNPGRRNLVPEKLITKMFFIIFTKRDSKACLEWNMGFQNLVKKENSL